MGYYSYDYNVETALQSYSGLVICSAGNDNIDTDVLTHYPSGYNLDNIISVGASDVDDARAVFSNYGQQSVDIFAPGEEITVLLSDYYYGVGDGTSFSAPFVTGVAALIMSTHNENAAWVKNKILTGFDLISGLSGYCSTSGRLNAYKSVFRSHDYEYQEYDEQRHIILCDCGYTGYQYHNFIRVRLPLNAGLMSYANVEDPNYAFTYICSNCGYDNGPERPPLI